ncbi:MAG: peptidoglycan-binding protein [Magnetospirillum sp.]|nr:peptidoglycan-binding protein [Magnetospirillum sp.]
MKSSFAVAVLGALAASTAWAQQTPSSAGRPPWQSPGEPLAAAQTTREYVPNRDVIRAVQQRLNQVGYSTEVNGNYDANLRNNVLRFQSANGLRPTGEVDMSTIGALGINVQPVGVAPPTTAMLPPPAEPVVIPPAYRQVMERDTHMSSPQTRAQETPVQNNAGLTISRNDVQVGEAPPGFPPGYPAEDLGLY